MTNKPMICIGCNAECIVTYFEGNVKNTCPQCNKHSWGGKPLVTQAVHDARMAAHTVFDKIWNDYQLCSRTKAYGLLAKAMKLDKKQCHIAQFTEEQAIQAKQIAQDITNTLMKEKPLYSQLKNHPLYQKEQHVN